MAKQETFKIATDTITLTATTNTNTLDAITTTVQPSDITAEEFTAAVWTAIKKVVKANHIKAYTNSTPDTAVVNAVYSVTYAKETKHVVVPLIDLLKGDSRTIYNNKATMLQTATAKFINTEFKNNDQRTKARAKTEKEYKIILQWAFDFLTADREDGIKISANSKDVDIISGMLLKFRAETIFTVGESAIQAYIEGTFRQKIAGKEFFVTLYSVLKDQNGAKITSANESDETTDAESDTEATDEAAE